MGGNYWKVYNNYCCNCGKRLAEHNTINRLCDDCENDRDLSKTCSVCNRSQYRPVIKSFSIKMGRDICGDCYYKVKNGEEIR